MICDRRFTLLWLWLSLLILLQYFCPLCNSTWDVSSSRLQNYTSSRQCKVGQPIALHSDNLTRGDWKSAGEGPQLSPKTSLKFKVYLPLFAVINFRNFCLFWVCYLSCYCLVVSTIAINSLERVVSKITGYVSKWDANHVIYHIKLVRTMLHNLGQLQLFKTLQKEDTAKVQRPSVTEWHQRQSCSRKHAKTCENCCRSPVIIRIWPMHSNSFTHEMLSGSRVRNWARWMKSNRSRMSSYIRRIPVQHIIIRYVFTIGKSRCHTATLSRSLLAIC